MLKAYRQKRKIISEAANSAAEDGNELEEVETDFRKNIHLCEDFPSRVIKARNGLRPFIRKAKRDGKELYLKYNRLMIDGDAYEYDEITEDIVLTDK